MFQNKKVSVIIPCRNEEAALYSMLQNIPSIVDEVIVVDNGSTDNTAFIATTLGAKVIKEKKQVDGVGYGFAHQTGMKHAKGDFIVALDGDNTYPIEKIPEILAYMEKARVDFVSCARFPLSNTAAISKLRQLGVKILNLEASLLFGYHMKDVLSGMWVMRKECVRKLNAKSGEWNFSPEIKLTALMHPEIRFSEYHISHSIRYNGVSKQQIWKTGLNHMFYILELRTKYAKMHLPRLNVQFSFYKAAWAKLTA
ncbi:MAG: glycosyltransferase family 2 protein [Candidatus Levyibacteriota bacterium]